MPAGRPFHGYRSRKPFSLFGPLPCSCAYYYCGRCGAGQYPWDDAVGLTPKRLTPAAQELATLAGTLGDSFEEAAQEILPRLAGLHLGESSVARTTEDAGQRLGEILHQQHTLGPKRAPWQWHKDVAGQK